MTINGKTDGITGDDLLSVGRTMEISTAKIERIIDDVKSAVQNWEKIADKNHIKTSTIDMISNIINLTGKTL
ncbi:MAG: hypothetical protein K6F84_00495 [Lachnospiraceae bacterium]|nr:hypothetical protein [Lachnospiraceae bacterium]